MDAWIRHVLSVHLDPDLGSPFWIDRAGGMDPAVFSGQIRDADDLLAFGLMYEKDLAGRPLMDFIPRRFWHERESFITGETAGTGGMIKTTAFRPSEWREAFVDNFAAVAGYRGFPMRANWLYLGPSGPHIIGKTASECARSLNSMEPFTVDFDPRWFRKLPEDSISRQRYTEHIVSQALRIIELQGIEVIFATPAIIQALAGRLEPAQRRAIKGVHFGGMAVSPSLYRVLREEIFPDAVIISGYGNTLFGVSLELEFDPSYDITYYPFGRRLVFNAVEEEDHNVPVSPGEEGRLVVSRFDETFMIINLLERDTVTLCDTYDTFPGVFGMGIKNPVPASTAMTSGEGIY